MVQTDTSIFSERYPELDFFLRLHEREPWTFCEEEKNAFRKEAVVYSSLGGEEEGAKLLKKISLEKIEVLYIYGIGLGHYALPLFSWLAESPQRDLVFLEDDLEMVRLFSEAPLASKILEHPQIHLRLMLDPQNWKSFLEERAGEFSYDNIECIALESYRKKNPQKFRAMRLYLMRKTTVHHALFQEDMYYHVFSKNVLKNFPRIHQAFYANRLKGAFSNVPAIICGAGPSLQEEFQTLQKLEDRALIFAGGSAIPALTCGGILPHFAVAIDPNEEEISRFEKSSPLQVPLLYTNRLHPGVFQYVSGPCGYIHAKTGGPLEAWWEKEWGIEPLELQKGFDLEALSVTTTALELATTMGCNPIVLVGVDLAFTREALYTEGVIAQAHVSMEERGKEVRASERLIIKKDRQGKKIHTLVKWVMESAAISRFAKRNRTTTFINSTAGGIGFSALPYQALSEDLFLKTYPLKERIEELIETNRFKLEGEDPLKKIQTSLEEAKELTCKALEELQQIQGEDRDPETGKMVFYQMELEELLAYSLCLKAIVQTFRKTFFRMHRISSEKMSFNEKWEFLFAKWTTLNDLILYYLDSSFTK